MNKVRVTLTFLFLFLTLGQPFSVGAAPVRFSSPNYGVESVIIGGTGVLRSSSASLPPTITSAPQVSDITTTTATISWQTDKPSNSVVLYGTTSGSYGLESGQLTDTTQVAHKVSLYQLTKGVTYYYRVRSYDVAGNQAESAEATFTTDTGDITPPSIKGSVNVAFDSATQITVTWETSELANSIVEYGITQVDQYSTGRTDELTLFHRVQISGLQAQQQYLLRAKSRDAAGNQGVSPTQSLATLSNPSITEVRITDITLNSAVVQWKTTIPTNSSINYGTAASTYTLAVQDPDTYSTTHLIKLDGLTSGTMYYLRISGIDSAKNRITSDEYVFKTVVLPVISDFTLTNITANSVLLSWNSSSEIDELVRYDIISNDDSTLIGKQDSKGNDILSMKHSLNLGDLESDSGYRITVSGKDIYGNRALSPTLEFRTKIDKEPPKIENIRTDTSVDLGSRQSVQVLVSYGLSKPGLSKIEWGSGASGPYTQTVDTDQDYSRNKFMVIPGLTPGESYHFRITAHDKIGNTASSADYLVLAPTQPVSLFDLIFGQIRNNFGWLGNVGK